MSSFKCPKCNCEQSYTYRGDAYCYDCNNQQPESEVKTCAPPIQESSTFAQTAAATTASTATIADPGASHAATVESPVDRQNEQTRKQCPHCFGRSQRDKDHCSLCSGTGFFTEETPQKLIVVAHKELKQLQVAYELESESRQKWSNRCKKLAALVREATTGHLRSNCTCYWCKKLNKILNA